MNKEKFGTSYFSQTVFQILFLLRFLGFFKVRSNVFSRFYNIFVGFCPQNPYFFQVFQVWPFFPGFPGAAGTLSSTPFIFGALHKFQFFFKFQFFGSVLDHHRVSLPDFLFFTQLMKRVKWRRASAPILAPAGEDQSDATATGIQTLLVDLFKVKKLVLFGPTLDNAGHSFRQIYVADWMSKHLHAVT